MKSHTKNIRMSLRKLNMVSDIVRGAPVEMALAKLKFTPKKGARVLYKAIASAASNAEHDSKVSRRNLIVSRIVVQKGTTLRRGLPVSRGRWHAIQKRMCHVEIVLAEKNGTPSKRAARVAKTAVAKPVAPARVAKVAASKKPSKASAKAKA